MLSEHPHSQSSASTSQAGHQARPGESTARGMPRDDAAAPRGADQSQNAQMNGPDFSAAFSHFGGFPPHFGMGGHNAFGQGPFGMWPFGMPPFVMPPFGMPPFATGPLSMDPSAYPSQYHWGARWPSPSFGADGAGAHWWPWSWLTSWWHSLTAWWSWLMSFWPRPMPMVRNNNPGFESMLRSAVVMADFWYQWFQAMAQMAYQARQACQFFAEAGVVRDGPQSPTAGTAPPGEAPIGAVDLNKLRESLKSIDPMQAAQVMHAVQMMQAMDVMQRRQRSHPNATMPGIW